MHDFKFQFDKPSEKKVKKKKVKYEFYVPLENAPSMQPQEVDAVYFGEVIDKLYVVKPGFLYPDAKKGLNHVAGDELDYYYLVATLTKSPYLALLTVQNKDKKMKDYLLKRRSQGDSKTFLLDAFHAPNFGGARMQNTLFEKFQIEGATLPNTPILFTETE